MPYAAPTIDESGLHIPTYQDILEDMIDQVKIIFGNDIYLGNDSADYQMLSIFARKAYDTLLAVQLAYNNRSPISAVGVGLDSIVKLNGIIRSSASYSTAQVTLTGTPGIVVSNGIIQDINGYRWDLPASVTIGEDGTATASATCETIGAISALPGDINVIATPTLGWASVTNAASAVPGQPVEPDSQLRARQAISTELPSQTLLQGTVAGIATLPEVARFRVFENPTGSPETDPNELDLPAHSITCVVEGDTDENVARVIFENRGIGCYTNGSTLVPVTDENGMTMPIRFYRPTSVPVFATISIRALPGFITSELAQIKDSVVDYLNGLQIYEDVTISGLYGAALSIMPNLALPTFSIRSIVAGVSAEEQESHDIEIDFHSVAEGLSANIEVRLI